jgi:chromosome segregation ATPase
MTWANDGRFAVHENAMDLLEYLGPIEPEIGWQAEAIGRLQGEAHVLNMEIGGLQRQLVQRDARIDFLKTLNAGNEAAISDYRTQVEKLQRLVDTARGQLEAAATERDELRAAIDAADKQLDQKDAQIRDLRIELDAAQQVQQFLHAAGINPRGVRRRRMR